MPSCLLDAKPSIIGDALPVNNLRRMRPWSFIARVAAQVAGLSAAFAAGGVGASEPLLAPYSTSPELRIEALGGAPAAPRLRVQGNWPTPCLPTVEDISLEGRDLRIELRSKKPLCARTSLPFDLEINLSPHVGKSWPSTPLRVSVVTANSASGAAQLRGFALIAPQPVPRAVPSSGLWWPLPQSDSSAPTAGTGFSFEIQGNTIASAVLGRTGNGEAIWYFGTGKLRGRVAEIDLVAASSSAADGESNTTGNAVLALDFDGNGRATAWLGQYEQGENQPVLRQQIIELAHLPFAERTDGSAWQGDWVLLGATPGQSRSARQIHLSATSFIAVANYRISGDDGSVLSCERDADAPKAAPPRRCRLNDSNGLLIAEFDSIDINRLDGYTPDRTPVQLLRADKR
jgi:hypothetical protein